MKKLPDVSENYIAEKRGWFSLRPFPVYIIAAWSLFSLFNLQWTAILKVLKSGELAIFQFLLIFFHPLLLLLGGFSLLLLKQNSLYFFVASLAVGIASLRMVNVKFNLIIILGIIIYCLWLRRTGILK